MDKSKDAIFVNIHVEHGGAGQVTHGPPGSSRHDSASHAAHHGAGAHHTWKVFYKGKLYAVSAGAGEMKILLDGETVWKGERGPNRTYRAHWSNLEPAVETKVLDLARSGDRFSHDDRAAAPPGSGPRPSAQRAPAPKSAPKAGPTVAETAAKKPAAKKPAAKKPAAKRIKAAGYNLMVELARGVTKKRLQSVLEKHAPGTNLETLVAAIEQAGAKFVSAKKIAAKRTAPKRTAAKKTAPKKRAAKKTAPKKSAAKKGSVEVAAHSRSAPGSKPPSKHAPAKKTRAKKSAPKTPAPKPEQPPTQRSVRPIDDEKVMTELLKGLERDAPQTAAAAYAALRKAWFNGAREAVLTWVRDNPAKKSIAKAYAEWAGANASQVHSMAAKAA